MKAENYFRRKSKGTPQKGAVGEFTDWLEFCTFTLVGPKCLIVDANFGPADIGVLVKLSPGKYLVQVKGVDYGGDKRIARLRLLLPGREPSLGARLGKTFTDTAMTGICDYKVFGEAWSDDNDASYEKVAAYWKDGQELGVAVLDKKAGAVMPFVTSGFGDGTFPVYALVADGQRVGFEIEFIANGKPYPFSPADPSPAQKAKAGDPEAQYVEGLCCLFGSGAPDLNRAYRWLSKAAASGHPKALFQLGRIYADQGFSKRDIAKARGCFEAGASLGNADCHNYLGFLYEHAMGVPQDGAMAVKHYTLGVDGGCAAAATNLGNLCRLGKWVTQDLSRARALFELAAAKHDPMGSNNLGFMLQHGYGGEPDPVRATRMYERAARLGVAMAEYNLGLCHSSGAGLPADPVKAFVWYRKAADRGYDPARCNVGYAYLHGHGVAKDEAQAVLWFRKAAAQGHGLSQNNLGHCYETGQGVKQDVRKAVGWYRKAAEKGVALAQQSLGLLLIQGKGVKKNLQEGVRLLRESSSKGCAAADYELGVLHEDGLGVPQDRVEAVRLYRRAAAGGEDNAKGRLEHLMGKLSVQEKAAVLAGV